MTNLVQTLKDFLSDHGIEPDSQLFVACSGGVDSMVLLSVLLELDYQPEVIHCNFGLRGRSSEADQAFVKEFASENGLNLHCRSFDTADYASKNQLSIQMAARALRYEFFEELLAGVESGYVVLGHHADDSLETIFINLGRGTGLMPLSGISPVRGPYLRPFWLTPKKDIIHYAVEHQIRWREDMSNRQDNYQRNYIRHHLVTPLKEAFPEFDKGFTNTLRHTNDDRLLFQSLIDSKLDDLVELTGMEERFPLDYLRQHPGARALVFHWLKKFGHSDFASIESAIDSPVSGKIFESEQGRLLVDRDQLVFRFKTEDVNEESIIIKDTEKIDAPLPMRFKQHYGNQYTPDPSNLSVSLDLDLLKFPLTLRKWKKGDRFVPLGMTGTKKLSDYLIDAKVNRFAKENTWVLCSGDNICWVVGHRPDDRYKVTDKTKNTYFAQVINDHEDQ
jgi:tRNA(Ile)-lysidine synthase